MACISDRTEEYRISGTFSDLPAFVSVSRSVSLRVVCVQLIDAAPGRTLAREERQLSRPRRQALPAAVASLALPVAAASLALAAAPLLRRLPDRLLSLKSGARAVPMLPPRAERAARVRRPPEALPLGAGQPVPVSDEEMNIPIDAVIPAAMADCDGVLATAMRQPVAAAGVLS